jgi:sialic acid synthase SpsE
MFNPDNSVFVIAEAGVNHNGPPDLAMEIVDVASAVGADAIKFQTFDAVYAVLPKQIDLESATGHSNFEQKTSEMDVQ